MLKLLGKGGRSEVYLAEHQLLKSQVAVKVLPGHLAHDQEMVERFLREARAAASLRHPHIVRIHDVGHESEVNFIAMDFIEGSTLSNVIQNQGVMPEEDILQTTRQILQALSEAHRLGIIHRDIKPDNVIIDDRGDAVVMDFGIAKAVQETAVTVDGLFVGTPFYASPEQAQGNQVDPRTDIYSLGVTMYQMAAGRVPFQGEDTASTLYQHVHEPPDPLSSLNPGLSSGFCAFVGKCLEKSPERRFASSIAALNALETLLARIQAETGEKTLVIPQKKIQNPAPRQPVPSHGPSLGDASDYSAPEPDPMSSAPQVQADQPGHAGRKVALWVVLCLLTIALGAGVSIWFLDRQRGPKLDSIQGETASQAQNRTSAAPSTTLPVLPRAADQSPASGNLPLEQSRTAADPASGAVQSGQEDRTAAARTETEKAQIKPASPVTTVTTTVTSMPPTTTTAAPAPRPRAVDPDKRLEARLAMVQGISDYNAGRYEQAVAGFERYVGIFPQDQQGRDYLQKAQRALSDETGGRLEPQQSSETETPAQETEPQPSPGVSDDPDERRQARLALVQGVSEFNSGRYEKAVDSFLAFLRVFPSDAQGQDYLQKARRMMSEKQVGTVTVQSSPPGRVFLDGQKQGHTPATLTQVPVGMRNIEVRALGGKQSRQVMVRGGSVLEVQFQLLGGVLIVKSSPSASISFDDKDMGLTPVRLESLPLGEHRLTLSRKDYHPKTRTVTIRGDYPLTLNLKLRPLKPAKSKTVLPKTTQPQRSESGE